MDNAKYGYIAIIENKNIPNVWIEDCNNTFYDTIEELKTELVDYMIDSDTEFLQGTILAINKTNFSDIKTYNFNTQTEISIAFNIEKEN